MSGIDALGKFDPMELLTPEICNAIQIGSNGIVRDYWNNFLVFLTCFTVYDDMVRYGDQDSRVRIATGLMDSAMNFSMYSTYLVRVVKFRFPQLTDSDTLDMIDYLRVLTPSGDAPPGPQLDELSQRFRAEVQAEGALQDLERLRGIVLRYEPYFRSFFAPRIMK